MASKNSARNADIRHYAKYGKTMSWLKVRYNLTEKEIQKIIKGTKSGE